MFWFNKDRQLLREILRRIERIERRLEPTVYLRVKQVVDIGKCSKWSALQYLSFWSKNMASIQAGSTGEFAVSGVASDNSTVTLSSITLTADDPAVTVEADASDPTGASFVVTVPATDQGTVVNLTPGATAVTSTSQNPTVVATPLAVTIQPSTQPTTVTVTLSVGQK